MEKDTSARDIRLNASEAVSLAAMNDHGFKVVSPDYTCLYVTMDHPLNKQVAGNHYKSAEYEPIEYAVETWGLGYLYGNATKYLVRKKDSRSEDLKKAIHYMECILWYRKSSHLESLGECDKRFAAQYTVRIKWVIEAIATNDIISAILIARQLLEEEQDEI